MNINDSTPMIRKNGRRREEMILEREREDTDPKGVNIEFKKEHQKRCHVGNDGLVPVNGKTSVPIEMKK